MKEDNLAKVDNVLNFFKNNRFGLITYYLGRNAFLLNQSAPLQLYMIANWISLNNLNYFQVGIPGKNIYEKIYASLDISLDEAERTRGSIVNSMIQFLGTLEGYNFMIKEWKFIGHDFPKVVKSPQLIDFEKVKDKRVELTRKKTKHEDDSYIIKSKLTINHQFNDSEVYFNSSFIVYNKMLDWLTSREGTIFLANVYLSYKGPII
jgi:hypothetical protein